MSSGFAPFSHLMPRTRLYWALRPQKAIRRLLEPFVPLAVRVQPCADPAMAGRASLGRWSYDQRATGGKLHLTLESQAAVLHYESRWRPIAVALWRMIRKDPALGFHEVPTDLNDGPSEDLPESVFVFSRPRGSRYPLLPTRNILMDRRSVPRPLPWEAKRDALYFRGAFTGSPDLAVNARVALCRAARELPGSNCRLTRFDRIGAEFQDALEKEGLAGSRDALAELNRYRYLVDADGNTTSWDRYLWIGTFGGVPILFEPAWEECWHGDLVEGENCIVADRNSLGSVLRRLREDPGLARRIAAGASELARTRLSTKGAQAMFEASWRGYLGL